MTKSIARGLDEPPVVLGDLRLDQLAPVRPQPRDRALLVGPDEPRVTRDVRCENGGEPTLHEWLCSVGGPTGRCAGLIIWGVRRGSAGVCMPKIRFCNIDDEDRRGLGQSPWQNPYASRG